MHRYAPYGTLNYSMFLPTACFKLSIFVLGHLPVMSRMKFVSLEFPNVNVISCPTDDVTYSSRDMPENSAELPDSLSVSVPSDADDGLKLQRLMFIVWPALATSVTSEAEPQDCRAALVSRVCCDVSLIV